MTKWNYSLAVKMRRINQILASLAEDESGVLHSCSSAKSGNIESQMSGKVSSDWEYKIKFCFSLVAGTEQHFL